MSLYFGLLGFGTIKAKLVKLMVIDAQGVIRKLDRMISFRKARINVLNWKCPQCVFNNCSYLSDSASDGTRRN